MVDEDNSVDLQNLIHLQELELQLAGLRARVENTPREIAALDDQLEAERQRLEEAKKAIDDTGKERRSVEGEVEALRQKLVQYQDQLMLVKTNTEYQAMLHEIEYAKQNIEEKEDQVLEQLLKADEHERSLRELTRQYEVKREELDRNRQQLDEFLEQSSAELTQLESQLEEVKSRISGEYLARYKRIAAARNGLALVSVLGNSCQGCHVRLRPQLLAEVKTNRRVILCENCSRILYYPSSE